MKENQTIEYKEIWKDDYLKHICAFANTQGGIRITFYKITTPITELETKIINCIIENNRISKYQLGKKLGMTKDGISYHIKKMKEKKIIIWIGTPRNGYWQIIDK